MARSHGILPDVTRTGWFPPRTCSSNRARQKHLLHASFFFFAVNAKKASFARTAAAVRHLFKLRSVIYVGGLRTRLAIFFFLVCRYVVSVFLLPIGLPVY